MFIAALFIIAKIWKCPSTDKWIKKMWCIYTMEYYSAIKKNKMLPFATAWITLEGIMLSEISQGKTNTVYHFYVESKKRIQMNLYTKQTQRHRKQIYGYQKGGWGGELGV